MATGRPSWLVVGIAVCGQGYGHVSSPEGHEEDVVILLLIGGRRAARPRRDMTVRRKSCGGGVRMVVEEEDRPLVWGGAGSGAWREARGMGYRNVISVGDNFLGRLSIFLIGPL